MRKGDEVRALRDFTEAKLWKDLVQGKKNRNRIKKSRIRESYGKAEVAGTKPGFLFRNIATSRKLIKD